MDCTNDTFVAAAGCSVEESIIPSIFNAFSPDGQEEVTDGQQSSNTTINYDRGLLDSSIHGEEGPGPSRPSPTPESDESSFMDAFPSSREILNALSIYDETSGIMSRTREGRNGSNSSSNNNNNNNNNSSSSRFASLTSAIFSYDESGLSTDSHNAVRKRLDKDTIIISSLSDHTSHYKNDAVISTGDRDHDHHDHKRNVILQRFHLREVPPPAAEALARRSRGSFQSRNSDAGSTHKILVTRSYEVKEHVLESIFYVSTSAVLGSVIRTYMARLFGYDCEIGSVNDFMTPLSSKICVTNGGRTFQTGGALFYDFPANVLGSFVMGLITPRLDEERARFPWLHRDHALQRDDVFHASLATGFCGCLTTFASWNTQMVVMLDGTYCDLGSQVVTVLFGYAIGLIGATCGFQFGRQCGHFLHNLKHANEENEEIDNISVDGVDAVEVEEAYKDPRSHSNYGVELVDDDEVKLKPVPNHLHKIPLFLAAAALLVAFVIGDFVQGNQYYRGMTMLWFLSPFGSLLRWRMSVLNTKRKKRLWGIYFVDWVPWGTFFANILAAILSACLTGLNDRYFTTIDPMERNWVQGLIFAINTGFAGSLSTVSTMIKETIILAEQHKGEAKPHYYAIATCGCGMLLGIAVYATTVRINN